MEVKSKVEQKVAQYRGRWVRVVWLDAATIRNVPRSVRPHDLRIYTEKTTPGVLAGLYKDGVYGVTWLLLKGPETTDDLLDWTSIPLRLILDIVPITDKETLRASRLFHGEDGHRIFNPSVDLVGDAGWRRK